jgi:hypothetical protein
VIENGRIGSGWVREGQKRSTVQIHDYWLISAYKGRRPDFERALEKCLEALNLPAICAGAVSRQVYLCLVKENWPNDVYVSIEVEQGIQGFLSLDFSLYNHSIRNHAFTVVSHQVDCCISIWPEPDGKAKIHEFTCHLEQV